MVRHLIQKTLRPLQKKKDFNIRVTPLHPRANGQVECFMQILNKTEQIAHLQGRTGLDRNMGVHDVLVAYRDTSHPAIGVTPYQAMSNRPIRTKLSHTTLKERSERDDDLIDEKDKLYKEKMRHGGTNTREYTFIVDDYVLLKQKVNKMVNCI